MNTKLELRPIQSGVVSRRTAELGTVSCAMGKKLETGCVIASVRRVAASGLFCVHQVQQILSVAEQSWHSGIETSGGLDTNKFLHLDQSLIELKRPLRLEREDSDVERDGTIVGQ